MNIVDLNTLKQVEELLKIVLDGKVENLPEAQKAKELVTDLMEFKDFNLS